MAKQRGLGKGLDALFVDNSTADSSGTVTLKLTEIEPNRAQPRKDFNEEALAQLADSIRTHGGDSAAVGAPQGEWQLPADSGRTPLARRPYGGLSEVPVVIREMENSEAAELSLIENLQREDLNPMEEALGYQELMEQYGMTQEQVAQRMGKSRSAVANALRLSGLPQNVQKMVRNGSLSAGQARSILAFGTEERMNAVAEETVKKGLTVRELERLAKKADKPESAPKQKQLFSRDSYYSEMELALNHELHRKVKIKETGSGAGTIEIAFYSREELSELADLLAGKQNKRSNRQCWTSNSFVPTRTWSRRE